MLKKFIAVVDAYGAGSFLAQAFINKGYSCIHIQSTPESLRVFKKISDHLFENNFIYDGEDIWSLINNLKIYNIIAVVAGSEPGVILADDISEKMALSSNGTLKSAARRDKYQMDLILAKNKIAIPDFCKITNYCEFVEWFNLAHKKNNLNFPVIIKPLDSAGTDGVVICENMKQVENIIQSNINSTNIWGLKNTSLLVQEYLKGEEYIVNSVSCNGKHYITDIWKCYKQFLSSGEIVYDTQFFMNSDGNIQAELVKYHISVLDVLGIKYGPAHAEIMYTNNGPKLIEIAARLGGPVNPEITKEFNDKNPVLLSVPAYINEEEFVNETNLPYQRTKFALTVFLKSEIEGVVKEVNIIEKLAQISSVRKPIIKIKPGDIIKKTLNLVTSPGFLYLVSDTEDVLFSDYEKVTTISKESFILE
jgi:phosphoribosylamine-glycine ligase